MNAAWDIAQKAWTCEEVPIGAVIVFNGDILSKAHNLVERLHDPCMHAELIVIHDACRLLKDKYLIECDLYVTLEPCTMCAAAISYAKIRKLFYAYPDPKYGGVEHGVRFFTSKSCFYRPEIYPDVTGRKSDNIVQKFFKNLRAKQVTLK